MPGFAGFPGGKVRQTALPAPFFTDLLPQIDHLGELKVTLYAFWLLDQREGKIRYFSEGECLADGLLLRSFGEEAKAVAALTDALARAVQRGTLLLVEFEDAPREDNLYFMNTPRGRAAVEALYNGKWSPRDVSHAPATLDTERPNIYRLYEENIGPLTPLVVDALRDAEQRYPLEWVEEAVRIAVENNVRRWRYIDAILGAWKKEGRHEQNRRNPEENRRRYVEGEFADFIEH